jgi:hypothetical protein
MTIATIIREVGPERQTAPSRSPGPLSLVAPTAYATGVACSSVSVNAG